MNMGIVMQERYTINCDVKKGISWVDSICAVAMTGLIVAPITRIYFGVSEAVHVVPMLILACVAIMRLVVKGCVRIKRVEFQFLVLLLCTTAWLLVSNLWTISTERHLRDSLLVAAVAIAVASAIGQINMKMMELTMSLTCSIAVVASVLVLQEYVTAGSLSGWGMKITESYLVVSRLIGIAAVFLATSMTVPGKKRRYVLTIVLFAGLAFSLARGALVFGVVVTTVFMIAGILLRSHKIGNTSHRARRMLNTLAVLVAILLCMSLVVWGAMQVERTRSRFARMLVDRDAAFSGRLGIWSTSWANIARSVIFGYGIGSSGIMSIGTESAYPHNIILQVWLDGGVVAAVATITILLLPYYAAWLVLRFAKRRTDLSWLPYLAMYSFVLLEYMKSTNSYSARDLFLLELFALHALSSSRLGPANRV